ncbi:MAG: T9SS type A sorting domain-containing protein, partial [Flavobacteriales bacterium]|nr:T9SS type A sorting domain-containing protein [Flavobacteriales bacterium]
PLTVSATSTDDLYVHWTVDDACTVDGTGSWATTVQDLGIPISITESEEMEVKVYPNPSNGQFMVELIGVEGTARVQVMDMAGRMVYAEGVNLNGNFRTNLDLDVANGTYLLQIATEEGLVTRKIQIQ